MYLRRLNLALAVLSVVSAAYPALAGSFDADGFVETHQSHRWQHVRPHEPGQNWQHHHRERRRHYGRDRDWEPDYGGGYGVPTIVPGQGTYAGSVSVLDVPGHGTYYYAEGLGDEEDVIRLAPMAKIVDVTKGAPCSYENGVCVIRP